MVTIFTISGTVGFAVTLVMDFMFAPEKSSGIGPAGGLEETRIR